MTLPAAMVAVARQRIVLERLLTDMDRAQATGNLSRIGLAAMDARAAADELNRRLDAVINAASDAQDWSVAIPAVQPFEVV